MFQLPKLKPTWFKVAFSFLSLFIGISSFFAIFLVNSVPFYLIPAYKIPAFVESRIIGELQGMLIVLLIYYGMATIIEIFAPSKWKKVILIGVGIYLLFILSLTVYVIASPDTSSTLRLPFQ